MIVEPIIDVKKDFWDTNPQFKQVEPFATFYEKNKEEPHRNESSAVMWFITLVHNPYSILYGGDLEVKRNIALKTVFKGREKIYTSHKKAIQDHEDAYKKIMPPIVRMLDTAYDKLNEKITWLQDTTYSNNTLDAIDKGLKSVKQNWDDLKKIEESFHASAAAEAKGGRSMSMTETNQI